MENYLMNKKVAVHTLGCKVNTCESEAMRQMLRDAGCVFTEFESEADIYLIHTCTVTNIADRKTRQMLHRARSQAPNAVIAAVGCYVQERYAEHLEDDSVDVLVGNRHKGEIVTLLNEALRNRALGNNKTIVRVDRDDGLLTYETLREVHSEERVRAFVKVQDGCNQFCSYCIIPFARGRICSRPEQEVLSEVRALVDNGVKEVVITGIHLSSYGLERYSVREQAALKTDFGELPLLTLLKKIDAVPGLRRLRLGSLEPRIVTPEFAKELAGLKTICPQFHLSLQSGCDRILAKMNRKYTTAEYAECAAALRNAFDDPALTTDIIAGFPGETEEDFQTTCEYAKRIRFAQIHIFPYSRRKGTVADAMKEQLTEAVKKERAGRLAKIETELRLGYREKHLERTADVLFEEQVEIDGTTYYRGFSREYIPYIVESKNCLINEERLVQAVKMMPDGTLLSII